MRLSTFMYYDFHQAGVYCRSNLQCYCYYIEFGGVTFFKKLLSLLFYFVYGRLKAKRFKDTTALLHCGTFAKIILCCENTQQRFKMLI